MGLEKQLSPRDIELFRLLARRKGQYTPTVQLAQALFGSTREQDRQNVITMIWHLRRMLKGIYSIENVPRHGYRLIKVGQVCDTCGGSGVVV